MNDLNFHDGLDPSRWTEETTLHSEATPKEDGILWIRGLARRVGSSSDCRPGEEG